MLHIDYKTYFDRVYGCWLGKCIAGTIGAPYEGMKELLNFDYDPSMTAKMLPNDDLDLQVLWLSVLEEKGISFTSDDLADAFLSKCPYSPGEYGIFKKNYARKIHPPLSGEYNNRYYLEGMGCPIRSEIWACIAPGNPELAAKCAGKDGVLDHAGNSVYAEQFLAGMQAAAFFESDLLKLIDTGLSLIPSDCKFAGLVRDVKSWYTQNSDWKYVRSKIIKFYGHPDCTNMYQNMGFTLLSLLAGEMDFLKTTMIALNCGYDTDCTCASAGALLGIIYGSQYLTEKYGFGDQKYVLGVDITRRSDSVCDLAEDTCLMGLYFAGQFDSNIVIEGGPTAPVINTIAHAPVSISVEYNDSLPAIGLGDSKQILIHLENRTDKEISVKLRAEVPSNWNANIPYSDIQLLPSGFGSFVLDITVPSDVRTLQETNICRALFESDEVGTFSYEFGIVGAAVWQLYGPFWQNNVDMSELKPGESYYKYFPPGDKDTALDQVRAYHLNARVDIDKEHMTLDELTSHKGHPVDAAREPELVSTYEDRFSLNDLIDFQGPCAVYMVRKLISPEDRSVCIQIGHTDAYSLWINGDLISESKDVDWWTAENRHVQDVPLHKGENTIVLKLVRRGAKADFSLIFSKGGSCADHYYDFASANTI
ncbi:MAG: ADP-ribosylglycohydrolase family protein [Armatimonadota bacterium]